MLRFPNNVAAFPPSHTFRILALSGGGYRGLFIAEVLSLIQEVISPKPIAGLFSLFSGTSVGGIVAVGLALGRSPREIAEAIRLYGPKIFDDTIRLGKVRLPIRKFRGAVGGLLRSKYSNDQLRTAIAAVIGDTKGTLTVRDVPRHFMIITTCATTYSPFIISNFGSDPVTAEIPLVDALLATAAAPSYFPAVRIGPRSLVDGGLVANAPELVAVASVLSERPIPDSDFRVLSIGTAGPLPETNTVNIGARSLLRWILGDLVPLTLLAQERLVVQTAQQLLGDRYWRINAAPDPAQARLLLLDRADRSSSTLLVLLAQQAMASQDQKKFLDWLAPQSTIA